jgi:hypothetical protein
MSQYNITPFIFEICRIHRKIKNIWGFHTLRGKVSVLNQFHGKAMPNIQNCCNVTDKPISFIEWLFLKQQRKFKNYLKSKYFNWEEINYEKDNY